MSRRTRDKGDPELVKQARAVRNEAMYRRQLKGKKQVSTNDLLRTYIEEKTYDRTARRLNLSFQAVSVRICRLLNDP